MTLPVPVPDENAKAVWSGEGQDPWLPERLDALLNAAVAEQSVFEAVWEALTAWLVTTSRRVNSGPVPQPDEIFATAPAWYAAVDDIIVESIIPVMGWAYEGIYGPTFPWEGRPNVLAYLAGVRNRLSRTPEEVFDLVAGQIGAGVTLGEGIPELTARVEEVLSTTDTPRWKNRAVTIARTESLGALNGSRFDAFQAFAADTEEPLERIWLATADTHTRQAPRDVDGDRAGIDTPFIVGGYPLMFPGDPSGPAELVINCRCTTLLVEVGEQVNMADRQTIRRR